MIVVMTLKDKTEILSYLEGIRLDIARSRDPREVIVKLRTAIRMEAAADRSPFCPHCGLPVLHSPTASCTGIEKEA